MSRKLLPHYFSIFVVLLFLITGCTTVQKVEMTAEDKQNIKNIRIVEEIKYPEAIGCYSQESAATQTFFGIVGGYAANDKETKEMTQFIKNNNIHIEQIVRKQFEEQIPRKTPYKICNKKDCDANLMVEIKSYGLQTVSMFRKPKPDITMEAQLVSKDNRILW
jgi:hypothetical protein